ncbi:TM2 domain-containing protein [Aeromonas rivuli]|uniref:TM2 domain-containing protein n=2 Tax=Aeromonas TaxID=642 RepID=UPI001E5764E4|nr:TM2 domain-containing protein [Aeromonas rivuli]
MAHQTCSGLVSPLFMDKGQIKMKGTVIDFNEANRTGLISADDGKRYQLDMSEWKGSQRPKSGLKVDFSVEGEDAKAIYVVASNIVGSKKVAAALFAFFLGAFGAHKFYLGYTKQGVIMLLIFLFGFILLGFPSMVIGIIAFVEFVIYLSKSDEEFEQTYVIDKKVWF